MLKESIKITTQFSTRIDFYIMSMGDRKDHRLLANVSLNKLRLLFDCKPNQFDGQPEMQFSDLNFDFL